MGEPDASAASPQNVFAARLFDDLPARYDRLAEVLSLGQNSVWRRELLRKVVHVQPRRVLDVATGTAGIAMALARLTEASVVGLDISERMLERGRQRVEKAGLDDRIRLQEARAEDLPFAPNTFDAVTFAYLLRYVADPAATLAELARVLRPGGVMSCLDFFVPPTPVWRVAWRVYTRFVMPAAGYMLGGRAWWAAGRFLGPNIEGFYREWPMHRLYEAWREAGMVDVEHQVMSLGGGLVMWGQKHHG